MTKIRIIYTPGRSMDTTYFNEYIRTSKFINTLVMSPVNHLMASTVAGSNIKIGYPLGAV